MLMILCWITFIVSMTTLHCLGTFQSTFYLAANLQLLTASFIHHLVMPCLSALPSPPPVSNLVCIFCPSSTPLQLPTVPLSSSRASCFTLNSAASLWLFFFLQLFASLFSVFRHTEHTQGGNKKCLLLFSSSQSPLLSIICAPRR